MIYRQIILKRTERVVKVIFGTKIDVRVFGSCQTGLSLPNSDIDICLLGFNYKNSKQNSNDENRMEIIEILSRLMIVLQRFKWVTNLDPILKTKVPILKLEMDPVIAYNRLVGVDRSDSQFIEMYGVHSSLDLKENSLGL